MQGLRTRLAPIRGIPTKGGKMEDPNADLAEIFDTIENLPSLPGNMLKEMLGWDKK